MLESMADEVLTIREVAALRKLAEKTVYAMAQAGESPAFKIRRQWRIKRTEPDRRIDAQPRGGESGGGTTMAADHHIREPHLADSARLWQLNVMGSAA
jgi:excisionase family DNA binding protein